MKVQGNLKLLDGGELLGARVENLAADPITPYNGQVWFNTTQGVYKGYTGTEIMQFAKGGDLSLYLEKAGGTMTGSLILAGAPSADLEAATKKYVDDGLALKENVITGAATTITQSDLTVSRALTSNGSGKVAVSTVTTTELEYLSGVTSAVQTQIDSKVAKAGDTMTGLLTLSGAPTADLHASTKKYVDDGLALKENVITGAATTITQSNLSADRAVISDENGKVAASTVTSTEIGYVSGVTSSIQTQIDSKVAKAGDTMTGTLAMGMNKVTSAYVPTAATDLANKAYVDSAIARMNWQADVNGTQVDNTLDPTATPTVGDRYIITDAANLHANFGTIAGLGDDDIVEWDGSAWIVAFDLSAAGVLAEGTITWDSAANQFVRYYTSWQQFGGMEALDAGIGLIKSGNTVNVNLGAGISELPSDEVGIDVYTAGGLFLTEDGSTASTATGAQLSIKLDASTLTRTANGLKVSDAGVTETQLNASVAGNGLTGGAGAALAVGVGTGIVVAADSVAFDETYGDARYINTSGDTMTGILTLSGVPVNTLDAATKGYVDGEISTLNTTLSGLITTLSNRVNAGYFLYTSAAPGTSHTVTHNMGRQYVNVTVVDSNNEVVIPQSITFNSANQLTVVFNASIDCKVIVGGVSPAA